MVVFDELVGWMKAITYVSVAVIVLVLLWLLPAVIGWALDRRGGSKG